jgi:D,D-heptose 1,7-bisphosphate phosphatase
VTRPAVFLDRDGTINVDPGFLADAGRVTLFPGVPEALRSLRDAGFKIVIITNQSGIGRGLIQPRQLDEVNARIFELAGVAPDAIYMCFHHPEEAVGEFKITCGCRKPATGMVDRGIAELGVDPARSFVVGDRSADVDCGRAAGMRTVLVRTGHGEGTLADVQAGKAAAPDHVAADLSAAAEWILGRVGGTK